MPPKKCIWLSYRTHLLNRDLGCIVNKVYHTIATPSADTKTKGFAIIIRRTLKVKLLGLWADTPGRMTCARVEMSRRMMALIPANASNTLDEDFYTMLTQRMLELTDYAFVVEGI